MRKEDSVVLQGIAVLMMIVLHYFLDVKIYPESYFMFPEIFQRFAWTGRMCVAIFSFVSGYGMYHVMKKKDSFGGMLRECTKRLLQLYARLFQVIIICVYIPKLILGEEILISKFPGIIIGYNTVYNGAWWFVLEYMWFMLFAPFFAIITNSKVNKKIRILLVLGLAVIGMAGKGIILISPRFVEFFEVRMQPTFLLIFFEGFFSGKVQEFVTEKKWLGKIQKFVDVTRCPMVGAILCFSALVLRYLYSTNSYKGNADVLFVPIFCCGVSLCIQTVPKLKKLLMFMGRNSLYLWFVHNLVYDRLASFFKERAGYWLVFFMILFGISLLVSIFLKQVENFFCNRILKYQKVNL